MVLTAKDSAKLQLMIRKTLLAVRQSRRLLDRTENLVQQSQALSPIRIKRAELYSDFYIDQRLLEVQKLWPRL
jgi:hypothetical protein